MIVPVPGYCIPSYSKIEVYKGIHFFIFALNHRLWVLRRNTHGVVLTFTHNPCFEQK